MPSFRIRERAKSFVYAFRGVKTLVQSQHNAWIHLAATVLVVFVGIFFEISRNEWLWIILSIAIVWLAESFNTALEFLADAVSLEHNALIEKSKDVAAGGVLLAAIAAAIIGILVFLPYVLRFVRLA